MTSPLQVNPARELSTNWVVFVATNRTSLTIVPTAASDNFRCKSNCSDVAMDGKDGDGWELSFVDPNEF